MELDAYRIALVQSLVDLIVGIAIPAVVLILIVEFRPQLGELLDRLLEAEAFGVKWKFDTKQAKPKVNAAVAQSQALIVREPVDREVFGSDTARGTEEARVTRRHDPLSERVDLKDLVQFRPRGAVLVAWEEVLRALRATLGDAAPDYDLYDGPSTIKTAWRLDLITDETKEALMSLHALRRSALRNVVDREQAREYVGLCDSMISAIENQTSNAS